MLGRITDEGAGQEDGCPPGDDYASEHPDGNPEAAGDEDAVEEDKEGEFGEGEGSILKEGGSIVALLLQMTCE